MDTAQPPPEVPAQTTALVKPGFVKIDRQQWDVARQIACPDANDAQAEFFFNMCNRMGVDPFQGQVFFIENNIYVSSKHIRTLVNQSGMLEFIHGPFFANIPDDPTKEPVWVKYWKDFIEAPELCKIIVKRIGSTESIETVRYWREAAQQGENKSTQIARAKGNWAKRPMECFERVTVRKAMSDVFGDVVAGLMVLEEMPEPNYDGAGNVIEDISKDPFINKLFNLLDWTEERRQKHLGTYKNNKPAAIAKLKQEFVARGISFPEPVVEPEENQNIQDADIVDVPEQEEEQKDKPNIETDGYASEDQPEPTSSDLDETESPPETKELEDFTEGESPSLPPDEEE